jgi:hypothetical protein
MASNDDILNTRSGNRFAVSFAQLVKALAKVRRESKIPTDATMDLVDAMVQPDDYAQAIQYLFAFMLSHERTQGAGEVTTLVWRMIEMICYRSADSLKPTKVLSALQAVADAKLGKCDDPECEACEPDRKVTGSDSSKLN